MTKREKHPVEFVEAVTGERRRAGRPALDPAHPTSRNIVVRLAEPLRERLDARAAADGVKPAEIVRRALAAYLARRPTDGQRVEVMGKEDRRWFPGTVREPVLGLRDHIAVELDDNEGENLIRDMSDPIEAAMVRTLVPEKDPKSCT